MTSGAARRRGLPPHTSVALVSVVALAGVTLGCGATRAPVLDPKEHVRGEHTRVLREPPERLFPALLRALEDEGLRVGHPDPQRGAISTRPWRYAEPDLLKKLAQIGDLSELRGAGLARVSEFTVTYHLLLLPADETSTRLLVRSTIDAVDRSQAVYLGPGLIQMIPRHVEVPSRGVVERDLMRHVATSVLTTEEMLFLLGEPGVD